MITFLFSLRGLLDYTNSKRGLMHKNCTKLLYALFDHYNNAQQKSNFFLKNLQFFQDLWQLLLPTYIICIHDIYIHS